MVAGLGVPLFRVITVYVGGTLYPSSFAHPLKSDKHFLFYGNKGAPKLNSYMLDH